MKNAIIVAAALLLGAAAARAGDCRVSALHRMNSDTEAKIQAQVLDTLLGKGKAYAFLEMKAELFSIGRSEAKSGTGEMTNSRGEGKGKAEEKSQKQVAVQDKKESESRKEHALAPREMKLRVLHEAALPAEKLKAVKDALAALYPGALKPEDVTLVPAAFAPAQ